MRVFTDTQSHHSSSLAVVKMPTCCQIILVFCIATTFVAPIPTKHGHHKNYIVTHKHSKGLVILRRCQTHAFGPEHQLVLTNKNCEKIWGMTCE